MDSTQKEKALCLLQEAVQAIEFGGYDIATDHVRNARQIIWNSPATHVSASDAQSLIAEADKYALKKGYIADGSLLFTAASEGYEDGYTAALTPTPSPLPSIEDGGVATAPASDALLSELEELEKKATPAPWVVKEYAGDLNNEAEIIVVRPWGEGFQAGKGIVTNLVGDYRGGHVIPFCASEHVLDGNAKRHGQINAKLTAALRNAAPALLARVRAAEGGAASLRGGDAPAGAESLAKMDGILLKVAESQFQRAVDALNLIDGVIPFTEALGRGDATEYDTELDWLVREAQRIAVDERALALGATIHADNLQEFADTAVKKNKELAAQLVESDYSDPAAQRKLDLEAASRLCIRGLLSAGRRDDVRRRIERAYGVAMLHRDNPNHHA